MKKYGIIIEAENGFKTYLNIKTIIKMFYGKIFSYKKSNNHIYISIETNSAAYRLITKLTLRSKNIKQVYITQIP